MAYEKFSRVPEKYVPAAQGLKSQGHAGNAGVAKGCVVDKASTRDHAKPPEGQRLLRVGSFVQTQAVATKSERWDR